MTRAGERREREYFMRMALSLAERGTGCVSPNPRVGCVLVREREIVGWGYHRRYGGPHAEVEALRQAGERARGAEAYVNLEPCCHQGKTPPCAPQLVEAGVRRVVVGMTDPNPLVDCRGLALLEEAGLDVCSGVLEGEAKWLNRGFIRRMTLGRPWVTAKAAVSLDGDMALADGESRWISGPLSRQKAHLLRAEHEAILVGVGTIRRDDPELTVRYVRGRSPLRVVLDAGLETSPEARVVGDGNCLILGHASAPSGRAEALRARGAEVLLLEGSGLFDGKSGGLDLGEVLAVLHRRGVNYLLVEGGASVLASFFRENRVDEVSLFLAPKFLGRGVRIGDGLRFSCMEEILTLGETRVRQVGEDLWLEARPSCSPDL